MSTRRSTRAVIGGALACGAVAAMTVAAPAQAAPKVTEVYASSTFLPPGFAASHGNLAFVACATVYGVKTDGTSGPLPYPGCTGHVEAAAGVAYSRDGGASAQTLTVDVPFPVKPVTATVRVRSDATSDVVTSEISVSDHEYAHNPDAGATYGTSSTSSCVRTALGVDASYRGRLDSALPAVAAGADGWYVVDRDGNTVYRIDKAGALSVLAVLPPVKTTVSAALATSLGWPSCVVGTTVAFEAAPTEVEVGTDGSVYVAGLPALASGAHADRSVIYKIDPHSHKINRLPQRYAGPVDLAISTRGRLFVADLDDDTIALIWPNGYSSTYTTLADVLSIETDEHGRLYAAREATTGSDPHDGDVVRLG